VLKRHTGYFNKGQMCSHEFRRSFAPADYARWLSDEPDPRDLLRPFPAEPMRMWPISARVNKPENDEPPILEPISLAPSAA
jgi:putative SOS response-associated peptidase YedK